MGLAGSRVATRMASRSGRSTVTCRLVDLFTFASGLLESGLTSAAVRAQLAPLEEDDAVDLRRLEELFRLVERFLPEDRFFPEDTVDFFAVDFFAVVVFFFVVAVVFALVLLFFFAASASSGAATAIMMTNTSIHTNARQPLRCVAAQRDA